MPDGLCTWSTLTQPPRTSNMTLRSTSEVSGLLQHLILAKVSEDYRKRSESTFFHRIKRFGCQLSTEGAASSLRDTGHFGFAQGLMY